MSSEICLKQLESSSGCSPDHLDGPVLRSSSLSNLSCEIMVDAAANLRKRRWKPISSIKRFVKPSMASEQLNERRALYGRTENHYEPCLPSLSRSVDGQPAKPTAQKHEIGGAGEHVPARTAPSVADTSSSTGSIPGGVKMHTSSKNQLWQRKPKDSTGSQVIYGLSHSCASVPDHSLCVNPYFMPPNSHGDRKCYDGPVFASPAPAPGLPAVKLESLQRRPTSSTYFSFSSSVARRLSPPRSPPSYDEVCSSGDDRTRHCSSSCTGSDHQRSASEASLEGCEEGHSELGKLNSTSSAASSYSSTSCATWSSNTTPVRTQPGTANSENGGRHLSAHELRTAWSRRPLPDIPTSPGTDASDLYKHDNSSEAGHSSASVSPITPYSSSSSLNEPPRSYLLENFAKVHRLSWYWGPLSRDDSDVVLNSGKDGDFLLRDSTDATHFFALSVRSGGEIVHVLTDNRRLDEEWRENSSTGTAAAAEDILQCLHARIRPNACGQMVVGAPSMPAGELLFLTAKLRYTHVPSLQHLCRLALRADCCLSREDIEKLHLPDRIKMFLDQRNVYTEYQHSTSGGDGIN